MPHPGLDIKQGDRFGRLTIITETATHRTLGGYMKRYFVCKCDCGNIKKVRLSELRNGKIKSCGCLAKELNRELKLFFERYRKRIK